MGMMRGDCRTEPPGGLQVRWWVNWSSVVEVDDTEVDGCADYCEGLCGVSDLHELIRSSMLGWQSVPGEV